MEFINEESRFFNGMVRNNNERLHGSGFLNVVSLILSQSTVTLSIAIAIDKVTVLLDKMRDMTNRQAWAAELLLWFTDITEAPAKGELELEILFKS